MHTYCTFPLKCQHSEIEEKIENSVFECQNGISDHKQPKNNHNNAFWGVPASACQPFVNFILDTFVCQFDCLAWVVIAVDQRSNSDKSSSVANVTLSDF